MSRFERYLKCESSLTDLVVDELDLRRPVSGILNALSSRERGSEDLELLRVRLHVGQKPVETGGIVRDVRAAREARVSQDRSVPLEAARLDLKVALDLHVSHLENE